MHTSSPDEHVENRFQPVLVSRGMSLIEVMIAMSILAVALLVVIGHQATLNHLRAHSLERSLQTVAVNNLVNLVDGSNWDELGRAERPWSLSRLQAGGTTNPPMQIADLVGAGVIASETGYLSGSRAVDSASGNLRIYFEYYRATANLDAANAAVLTQPGLLDAQQTSSNGFHTAFASNAIACRIVPNASLGLVDAAQITAGNPVLVRLAVSEVEPVTNAQRQIYETFLGAQTAPQ